MFWHTSHLFYDDLVARLMRSAHPMLKEHYFIGICMWTGKPVLVPRSLLNEHVQVTGGSGSGKSATILGPLCAQFVARKNVSVVFVDQKDDSPSFFNLFDCAYKAGLPFKYFSPVVGDESFIYNPLRQAVHKRFSVSQRAEWFAQTAGIDYGEIYGGSFFQGKSELVLSNYLTHYSDPPVEDFGELYRLFDDKHAYANIGHVDDYLDASHFRPLFGRLAGIYSLNRTPRNLDKTTAHAAAMDMSELLRSPTVYYFKFPASLGRNAGRFMARTVIQNAFANAGLRAKDENTDLVIVCDEFQELLGSGVDLFLEQCRSRGITVVLAHQSIQQLERNGVKLLPVVQACTSIHIVVEASDADSVEYVRQRSGRAYFGLASWSQEAPAGATDAFYENGFFAPWKAMTSDGRGTPLVNVREELDWRLSENAVRRVSADPMSAFIAIKKNSGLVNSDGVLFPIRCFFHIDKKLFEARKAEPWPKWDRPETVIVQADNPFTRASKGARGSRTIKSFLLLVAIPCGLAFAPMRESQSNQPCHSKRRCRC